MLNGLSTFNIYQTEADWRVVRFKYTGGEFVYVEHRCCESKFEGWEGCRYTYSSFPVPCHECEQLVPDGLQCLYVLLSGDMDTHADPWMSNGCRFIREHGMPVHLEGSTDD